MSIIENKKEYRRRVIDITIEAYLEVSSAVCVEKPKWCGKTWTSAFCTSQIEFARK